jgi:hypothetical protein
MDLKALMAVNIMEHILVQYAGGECHGCWDMRSSNGGLSVIRDLE